MSCSSTPEKRPITRSADSLAPVWALRKAVAPAVLPATPPPSAASGPAAPVQASRTPCDALRQVPASSESCSGTVYIGDPLVVVRGGYPPLVPSKLGVGDRER